jgi:predicted metal-dependent hydrolase
MAQLDVGGVAVDVVLKNIKNVHLSVYPPTGKVRISAPLGMKLETIRVFAVSKISWIRSQQHKVLVQGRETPREYLERESHYLWGKRYLLQVIDSNAAASVEIDHNRLVLRVRQGATEQRKADVLDGWYREQIKNAVLPLIAQWEKRLGISVGRFHVQRMKTRWGSCNAASGSIRLNTDLAKKPRACLEYILVHEMAHFREQSHNAVFTGLMDSLLPNWRLTRDELNSLPLRHEDWIY